MLYWVRRIFDKKVVKILKPKNLREHASLYSILIGFQFIICKFLFNCHHHFTLLLISIISPMHSLI